MDFLTVSRMKVLSEIITEQSNQIMLQAEQLGRVNEMLQQERAEKEALKKELEAKAAPASN